MLKIKFLGMHIFFYKAKYVLNYKNNFHMFCSNVLCLFSWYYEFRFPFSAFMAEKLATLFTYFLIRASFMAIKLQIQWHINKPISGNLQFFMADCLSVSLSVRKSIFNLAADKPQIYIAFGNTRKWGLIHENDFQCMTLVDLIKLIIKQSYFFLNLHLSMQRKLKNINNFIYETK